MIISSRFRLAVVLSALIFLQLAAGQKGGGGKGSGSPSTNVPTIGPPANSPDLTLQRQPIFISGRVLLDGGMAPPEPVLIERVCNGMARREGYSDAKGHFEFQLGQNNGIQDASESSVDPLQNTGMMAGTKAQDSRRMAQLMGCELRAVLPGFHSTNVMMRLEDNFGQLNVGTIFLKRMDNVSGSIISLTTMQAPKDARHAFEKAQKQMAQKKTEDAEKELTKAVQLFPHFAAAWSLLGEIHEGQNQWEQSQTDYTQAIASDPVFVNPYFGLAVIAIHQKKWQEAVKLTGQVEKLNPFAYPVAYLYSAAANFYLGNLDAAEEKARKFESLDTDHRRPDVALLLSNILESKHDYAGAAQMMRTYLERMPNAPNATALRAEANRLENLSAKKEASVNTNK
ncbi:MAG TPA: tetratricopeptide repeat protein [Candidatus Solibacter sp.]|jgi:Tfp pilus assembly protein PilF|nr:tetratricopeptide repeat protein [Candidatus Solibacter sp.]